MRSIVYAALLSTIGACGWFAQTAPSLAACDGSKCIAVYGLATVAKDQSPRITLYNGAPKTAMTCTAQIDLIDETGKTLASVTKLVGPDQTAMLDQGAFFDGGLPIPTGATHLSMRPVIRFIPPNPCQSIVTTFDVFDTATGRVGVIYPPNPIRPVDPWQPTDPIFGFNKTTADDIARINLTNTGPAACMVQASFVDNTGKVLQSQTKSLESGKSLVVEQVGGTTMRPVLVKQRVGGACQGLIQKVEMVDAAMDKTRFIWPTAPQARAFPVDPMMPAP